MKQLHAAAHMYVAVVLVHLVVSAHPASAGASVHRGAKVIDVTRNSWGNQHLRLRNASAVDASQQVQTLRVCNAFAFATGLDVFHTPGPGVSVAPFSSRPEPERLTKASGLVSYKRCYDFRGVALESGSELGFWIGDSRRIGTFVVRSPAAGSVLQLVVHRFDPLTTTAGFIEHAFSEREEPQVAIVDAYCGGAKSSLEIRDEYGGPRGETARFGTVISVGPGVYEMLLHDDLSSDRRVRASGHLQVSSWQKYTVIRVGVDAIDGPAYPEELVVFPTNGVGAHGVAALLLCAVAWWFDPRALT